METSTLCHLDMAVVRIQTGLTAIAGSIHSSTHACMKTTIHFSHIDRSMQVCICKRLDQAIADKLLLGAAIKIVQITKMEEISHIDMTEHAVLTSASPAAAQISHIGMTDVPV